ncbi:MAG TPA: response regulator [Chloroflexota bacterium]|nr:response regulator [Chloroflexota bacterium]
MVGADGGRTEGAGGANGAHPQQAQNPRPTGRRRILVVDDERHFRTFLADMLETEGYAVSEARNGAEALQAVREDPPDAIILDFMMPELDGGAFLRAFRGGAAGGASGSGGAGACAPPPVPVIVASAFPAERVKEAAPGADGYLTKPFPLDDLFSLLTRLLG